MTRPGFNAFRREEENVVWKVSDADSGVPIGPVCVSSTDVPVRGFPGT